MRLMDWSSDGVSSDLDDVAVQVRPQLLVRDGEAVELQAASILPGTFEGDGAVPSGEEPRARVLWRTDVAGAVEAEGDGAAAVALQGEVALRCGEVAQRKSEVAGPRSEEHTSELQSLMRISYAAFCLKTKKQRY